MNDDHDGPVRDDAHGPCPLPDLLTTEQVAQRLQMSEAWVRLKIASGELPVIRLGRRTLFDTCDVRALIERGRGRT